MYVEFVKSLEKKVEVRSGVIKVFIHITDINSCLNALLARLKYLVYTIKQNCVGFSVELSRSEGFMEEYDGTSDYYILYKYLHNYWY